MLDVQISHEDARTAFFLAKERKKITFVTCGNYPLHINVLDRWLHVNSILLLSTSPSLLETIACLPTPSSSHQAHYKLLKHNTALLYTRVGALWKSWRSARQTKTLNEKNEKIQNGTTFILQNKKNQEVCLFEWRKVSAEKLSLTPLGSCWWSCRWHDSHLVSVARSTALCRSTCSACNKSLRALVAVNASVHVRPLCTETSCWDDFSLVCDF